MFYVAGKWGTTVSTHPTMLPRANNKKWRFLGTAITGIYVLCCREVRDYSIDTSYNAPRASNKKWRFLGTAITGIYVLCCREVRDYSIDTSYNAPRASNKKWRFLGTAITGIYVLCCREVRDYSIDTVSYNAPRASNKKDSTSYNEDSLVQPLQESMFYVAGKWGTTVSTHPTMLQEQVIKSEDSLVQPLQESMFYVAGKWGTTVSTHPTMLPEQIIKVKIPWYSHYRNLCSMLQGSEGLQYRHILQCSKSK